MEEFQLVLRKYSSACLRGMCKTIKIPLLYDVQRANYVVMEPVYMEVSINLKTLTLKNEKTLVHAVLLDVMLRVMLRMCSVEYFECY